MKLVGNFEYLGQEAIQGKKDPSKTFYNVVLMQGIDTVKVFVNADDIHLFQGLKKMDQVQCGLNISIGQKTYINIIDVKKL